MATVPHLLISLGWNKRPLTYSDFDEARRVSGITLIRPPMKTKGMFFFCDDEPLIALSNKLKGVELWLVAWHEMIHFLLHPPGLRCFSRGTLNKAEAEARRLSICAVIDECTLHRILVQGELHDFPKPMLDERISVIEQHGY